MGQAEQLSNAATELKTTAGKYTTAASELGSLVGTMSAIMYGLLDYNAGTYVQAAIKAWQRGARDAYRLMDALDSAASAMQTLASGIESHVGAIQSYEGLQNTAFADTPSGSKALQSAEKAATTAWAEIAALSRTFVSTLATSAEPHVVGACSTGNEPLLKGQTDGTNKQQYEHWLQEIIPGLEDYGPEAGAGGAGGGGGGNWWDKFWEDYCQDPSESDKQLGKFQKWLSQRGVTMNITRWPSKVMVSFTVAIGYGSNQILQQALGLNDSGSATRSIVASTLTGLIDGPLYFEKARQWQFTHDYKLNDCTAPMLIGQAGVGMTANTAFLFGELGLQKLWKEFSSTQPHSTQTPTRAPVPPTH
jgi:hypothetical protein